MKKLVLFLVVLLCVLCMVAGESASPESLVDDAIESMQEELSCNEATFADAVESMIGSVRRQVEFTCGAVAGIVGDCLFALRFIFEKI